MINRPYPSDTESLFVSGRLPSFWMMKLVIYLEQEFSIDFAEHEFDVDLIDSIEGSISWSVVEAKRQP